MGLKIVDFNEHHLDVLELQEDQKELESLLYLPVYRKTLEYLDTFTAIDTKTNEVICCAGFMLNYGNRLELFTYMSKKAGKHMFALYKKFKRFIESADAIRIEAHVKESFCAGKRLMELLGFKKESILEKYMDNQNFIMYVRFK